MVSLRDFQRKQLCWKNYNGSNYEKQTCFLLLGEVQEKVLKDVTTCKDSFSKNNKPNLQY